MWTTCAATYHRALHGVHDRVTARVGLLQSLYAEVHRLRRARADHFNSGAAVSDAVRERAVASTKAEADRCARNMAAIIRSRHDS